MPAEQPAKPARICRTVADIRRAAIADAAEHTDLTDTEAAKVLGLIAPYRDQITQTTAA